MEDKTITDQNGPAQFTDDTESIKSVKFSPLEPVKTIAGEGNSKNMDMLMDVHIPVLVELGKTEMLMRDVMALTPGSIIELDSLAGEPVKISVRGKIIAFGEVVVVDENFGVKITRIASA
ncbi:MAG: flagellar motor switch protein FliN [Candidatus Scalindua sp.]|nr:flagellar motor switch protein FliN [Candidatus Scalindua sp.]MCR4344523.1 flagellar motor switch protein FliN [Candidatus Scalindua sp.]